MTTLGCICGISVGAAIGFMGFIHCYHILYNLTTIEMHTTDIEVRMMIRVRIILLACRVSVTIGRWYLGMTLGLGYYL